MALHGLRYADEENAQLQAFLENVLPTLDYFETCDFYRWVWVKTFKGELRPKDHALINCNDRYFLLTQTFERKDALHPWLFERSREVEAEPDNCLDLWARDHYKSSIITYSGAIQEVLRDPEITIAIFSHTKDIAKAFLIQIKQTLEQKEWLKLCHEDCLWQDPANEAPIWSQYAIVVKRRTNPKEKTVEAHGLVNGQPTSKHFFLRIYDDVVTRESVSNEDQVKKTTESWELSDNLGGGPQRKWHIGTRYSYGDTWGHILSKGLLKPRLFPATEDGTLDGKPVFLSQERWDDKKKTQASQVAAQMLQNPLMGKEQMFDPRWMRSYLLRPRQMTVYIMADPSKGSSKRSDRTGIAVIGIDAQGNKYFLDGYRHRMSLSDRWEAIKNLYKKWTAAPGVQLVSVGYERYGMQTDMEYFQECMTRENFGFPIQEVSWTREGDQSKKGRVERLQPDIQHSKFYLPALVWQHGIPLNLWRINEQKGDIEIRPLKGDTTAMTEAKHAHEEHLIIKPIVRRDEDGNPYDLTREFITEAAFFPLGVFDDLLDAASRIYDMQPCPPVMAETTEALKRLTPSYIDA